MRRLLLLIPLFALCVWGCSDNDDFSKLPDSMATFISRYWPGSGVSSFTSVPGHGYEVIVRNGPTINFDTTGTWTSVNGNGLPLPEIFIYDNMPTPLYQYLESGGLSGSVFTVARDARYYQLTLLNQDLTYNISTGRVTQTSR